MGRNNFCKRIILTQEPSNSKLKEKAITYNLAELWNKASKSKQRLILEKFNISEHDYAKLTERPVILLTQPLSEDKAMTECEKVSLYRNLAEPYGLSNVILKPHPRERTDYSKMLPELLVFDKVVPFQLFGSITFGVGS
jgi:hypothetical protein